MITQENLVNKIKSGRAVPYNLFCLVAIVILLANIFLYLTWSFTDYTSIRIYAAGIGILLVGMIIFRYHSPFIAILLVVVVLNCLIFWMTYHLGRPSGGMMYYFPFLVGFLYLFLYKSSLAKTIAQAVLMVILFLFSLVYTHVGAHDFFLPETLMNKVYIMNLSLSIAATIVLLVSLYYHFMAMHRSVLHDQQQEHREFLRDIDLQREKEGYSLLLSIRDDISQRLATGRLYLQAQPEKHEMILKADELVKTAMDGLNDISVELSPAMLIDLGFKEGLETYAGLLSDKYHLPVSIELEKSSADIPDIDRLSLYRILQQCISIIAGSPGAGFLKVKLHCANKVTLLFHHGSAATDFSIRFQDTRNRDLAKRLRYYESIIREEPGKVQLILDMREIS
ncbi:MAG: hypothetical protein HZA79_08735 [Sphingobacteriales bacterium]|nr:hypothetical protein [Sphingobacteriales bacterium]